MFGPLYGQLIETTVRVVGWNVWGRYGPWEAREAAIITTLSEARADIVVLAESWAKSEDSQGGEGCTWSNSKPWATQLLWPDRRIDYIFTATPRRGGAGHPLSAALIGTAPVHGIYASDHFAVQADVRC